MLPITRIADEVVGLIYQLPFSQLRKKLIGNKRYIILFLGWWYRVDRPIFALANGSKLWYWKLMRCFNRLSVNVSKSESIGWLMLVSSSEASWAAGFRKHERSSDRISITSWHNCLWGRPILSGHWRSKLSYIYITRVLSAWWFISDEMKYFK